MIVSAVLPHLAVAPETKLVPLIVSVNAAPPAIAEVGLRLVIVGGKGLMVKTFAAEVPPLVVTVTFTVPADPIRPALTVAVTWVALTRFVVSAVLPQRICAPDTKFVPVTVSVNAAPPATAVAGLRLVIAGGLGLMVKVAAGEVPPVVVTVTLAVPAVAICAAETAAVTVVALPEVVDSAVLPHFAVAPETKFVPLIVSLNPAPPATAVAGLKLLMVGGGGRMVKVEPPEVPPVVVTVTLAVPTAAIRLAGTAAVNCVDPTTVVLSDVVPHLALAPETKFVPFTVSVNAEPPAIAELGLRLVMAGLGGFTVNVEGTEVKSPAVTVTLTGPAVVINAAGTAATASVVDLEVVVSAVPPKYTFELLTKPVPFTVKVNAAPPATAVVGLRLVIVGAAADAAVPETNERQTKITTAKNRVTARMLFISNFLRGN